MRKLKTLALTETLALARPSQALGQALAITLRSDRRLKSSARISPKTPDRIRKQTLRAPLLKTPARAGSKNACNRSPGPKLRLHNFHAISTVWTIQGGVVFAEEPLKNHEMEGVAYAFYYSSEDPARAHNEHPSCGFLISTGSGHLSSRTVIFRSRPWLISVGGFSLSTGSVDASWRIVFFLSCPAVDTNSGFPINTYTESDSICVVHFQIVILIVNQLNRIGHSCLSFNVTST